ncbi:hypothetical protein CU097_000410, partial [Rhizopus azygosporus]
ETEDETEDLKVQKIDVTEEGITGKQEMHNQEQEIVPIEKNQTDTEHKIDVFDLTTESNIVSQLEEKEKALEAENFLQDDTTE